jgi:putative nucleotidyltransferase with HDIG domain
MKKRVEVEDLEPGMYVSELDCPWQQSPFPHGFIITTPEEIAQLQTHCAHVFVETGPGDSGTALPPDPILNPPLSSRLDRPELELEILKKFSAPGVGQSKYTDTHSMEAEIATIGDTYEHAVELINDLVRDIRLGRNINSAATSSVISELADSIIRNPDALVCLTLIRRMHVPTAQHGLRTCILALALGRHLGMSKKQLNDLGIGALLHDIGKTRVPQEILECGHELNEAEQRVLRKHVDDGVTILENTEGFAPAAVDIARQHHEHYNGSGYPKGLRENEISQFGHIGAIVNRYDNLINPRPGRRAVPAHKALKILYELRGNLFHPHLIEEFIRCMSIYPIGSIVEMRTGEVAVVVALNRMRRLRPRVALVMGPDQTAYDQPQIVDLTLFHNQHGEPLEIVNVADGSAYGFNPLDYLPIVA